jgi:serine/threonine protein kinase/tetratricopeptide (TPR) repeat protein
VTSDDAHSQWDRLKDIFDAALRQDASTRAAFLRDACAGDEGLVRELESLIANYDSAQSFLEQSSLFSSAEDPTRSDAKSERRIGPYRILRRIGRGGMADVYLAARSDKLYQRFVAVKLVRVGEIVDLSEGSGDAGADIQSRFRHERQALAVLDHPNIVKLLDGGTTEQGVPYLVMDYVQGVAIDEYCDTHRYSIRERLELFLTVCAAVQYAHQNLIVHRDLKPRNILVTPDGVPKLLDFGIAKLLRPELWSQTIGLTRSEVRLMTPAYASPEQLRGEPITTASDIYSLGVLLYELLTGHLPYPGKPHTPLEYERAVCEAQPEKPSTAIARIEQRRFTGDEPVASPESVSASREGTIDKLRRRLKGELDTIVLMALRKEPQRRYASVEQFAEDIRRHLKGLPVIACRDTFRYRSGKFIRRHKAALAVTAVVILMLVTAMAVAVTQSRVAHAQQTRAERRFNDIRQLARFMLFEFDEALQSGTTPARKTLIAKALDYLDRLAADASDDVSLQRELIEGYLKVGDLQGNLYGPNLGDQRGAAASYGRALQIAQAVHGADPGSVKSRRDVARAHQKLAELLSSGGDATEAITRFRAALEIFEAIAASDPADRQAALDLLSAWDRLGSSQYVLGDLRGALQSYERYLTVARRLAAEDRTDAHFAEARRILANADGKIGKVLALSGRKQEGLERLRQALATYEDLSAADPGNASLRRLVSVTYTNLGDVLAGAGRPEEALMHYRQGLRALERLGHDDPENGQSQRDLALTLAFLADVVAKTGDAREARALSARALGLLRALVEDRDASAVNHRDYAWLLVSTPFEDLRDPRTARRHAQLALQMTNGTDPSTLDTLATACFLSGDVDLAVAIEERALALLPPTAASGSGSHLRMELEANLARFTRGPMLPARGGSPHARPQQAQAKQP